MWKLVGLGFFKGFFLRGFYGGVKGFKGFRGGVKVVIWRRGVVSIKVVLVYYFWGSYKGIFRESIK